LQVVPDLIRRRQRLTSLGALSDAGLLERFLQQGDEAAFELLVDWHGRMVFGVCWRVLQHTQDAEDAFQETFLMLARKAATIGRRESVGGWLCTVAFHIALRVKMQSTRRARQQRILEDVAENEPGRDPADSLIWGELCERLDAELSQIPEKYRTAFILCHLEGKTCTEAAEYLGCPRGTVQSRIGRSRERLRARLSPALNDDRVHGRFFRSSFGRRDVDLQPEQIELRNVRETSGNPEGAFLAGSGTV
jgi:RNA polymerase sigma factor (sigma-70 family)